MSTTMGTLPRSNGKPSGRSMFGKQADSRKETFAMHSVPESTRETRSRAFITNEHLKPELLCTTGPGAVYELPSSLGRQPASTKRTLPSWSQGKDEKMKFKTNFNPGPGNYEAMSSLGKQALTERRSYPIYSQSKGNRDILDHQFLTSGHIKEQLLRHSAPVGTYDLPSTIGRQASSRNKSLPAYSFGASRTTRFKNKQEEFASQRPGPGSHTHRYSMGKQTLSTNRTALSSQFGSSTREIENKRFITSGHTRVAQGRNGEPAADYSGKNTGSIGKQVSSTKQSLPSYRFGTGKKMHYRVDYTPGPGAYDN